MTSAQLILVAVTSAFVSVFVMLVVATVARARGRDDGLDETDTPVQARTPVPTGVEPSASDEDETGVWKWAAPTDEADASGPASSGKTVEPQTTSGAGKASGSESKKTPARKKTTAAGKKTTGRKKPATASGGGAKKTSEPPAKRRAKRPAETPDE